MTNSTSPPPSQARHANPSASADLSSLRRHPYHPCSPDHRLPPPQLLKPDFFNGIRRKLTDLAVAAARIPS